MAKQYYSDLDDEVGLDNLGNINLVINADSIKSSINNILRTRQGERVMRPTFGANLHNLLFSPMIESVINQLAKQITLDINTWDNRVIVNSVNYEAKPEYGQVSIEINFGVKGYSDIFSHEVTLEV